MVTGVYAFGRFIEGVWSFHEENRLCFLGIGTGNTKNQQSYCLRLTTKKCFYTSRSWPLGPISTLGGIRRSSRKKISGDRSNLMISCLLLGFSSRPERMSFGV